VPEHPGSKAVGLSPNMWELMQSCWKVDAAARPSMRRIQTAIREMRPRRNCEWLFVSIRRILIDVKLAGSLPELWTNPSRLLLLGQMTL
jgi:hypothetical protein